jgi:iron complex outermembrane receptor protein
MKNFSTYWIFCTLIGASLPLTAQQSIPSTLPPIIITAETDKKEPLTVPSLNTRREQINATTPGGVSVIDAEDYKRGRASTLKDALDYAPGVFIQPRFGAEESRLSIRGSGIQRTFHGRGIKLMQDGAPLNLADGGFDMQAIEPLSARYIEVYRGANGLQYGSTTLGGAVNFVSRTGYDAAPLQARIEVGSFDTIRSQISSGAVVGKTDYYFSASSNFSDGFRDYSQQSSQRIFTNVGYRLSDDIETRFYVTYVNSDSELPGAVTKNQFQNNPQQANAGNLALKQKRDFQLFRVANKTTFSDGEAQSLTVSTFWSWKDLDHPIFQVIDQLSNDLGIDVRYDNTATVLGHENHFTAGVGYVYGTAQDNRFRNIAGQRGARTADFEQTSANLDLYLQDTFHLTDTLSLVIGGQGSYADRDLAEETLFGADNSSRQEYWGFSPKIGMIWEPRIDTQLYFNVSRSFEPPSFGELTAAGAAPGLVDLSAQRGTTLEFGSRGKMNRVSWDLSWYYSWLDNELLSLGIPGISPTQTVNAGRTIHHGIEAMLDVDLLRDLLPNDRLFLRQTYLFSDFHFDGDSDFSNNELPGMPRHYYRAELLYEHPCGFYAGPNVEWTPEAYFVDLANTQRAGSYALLGFKVGFRREKGPSFFIEAKNLTDEDYVATTGVLTTAAANSAVFFPGDGRAVYAGMEWKW